MRTEVILVTGLPPASPPSIWVFGSLVRWRVDIFGVAFDGGSLHQQVSTGLFGFSFVDCFRAMDNRISLCNGLASLSMDRTCFELFHKMTVKYYSMLVLDSDRRFFPRSSIETALYAAERNVMNYDSACQYAYQIIVIRFYTVFFVGITNLLN
jgi:hypothetical protein